MSEFDPYAILGVTRDAPAFVIQAAYRACIKRYHPDQYKGADARQRTADILEAYRLIGEDATRAQYDRAHPVTRKVRIAQRAAPPSSSRPPPEQVPVVPDGNGVARQTAVNRWAVSAALLVGALATFSVIEAIKGKTPSRGAQVSVSPKASVSGPMSDTAPVTAGTPAATDPAVASVGPSLDDVIQFARTSRCEMTPATEKLFTSMVRIDPETYAGSRGPAIRVAGFANPLTPTFERRAEKSESYDVRDNEATLEIGGSWHGLRVTKIRYRFMEESSFWEMQVRFLETPEHVRTVLNGLGFALPTVGEFRETSGPDVVTTGMGIEAIPGGAALTCGSSMYY